MLPSKAPKIQLAGFLDIFTPPRTLAGWVIDRDNPNRTNIRIVAQRAFGGPETVARITHRGDLAGHGPGNYGFQIDFPDDIKAIEIVSGSLRVMAMAEGSMATIPVEVNLHSRLSLEVAAGLLGAVRKRQESIITYAVDRALKAVPEEQRMYIHPVMSNSPGVIGFDKPSVPDEISSVSIPVGLKSRDLSAVMGRNGFLFLTGGTNRAASLYEVDPDSDRVKRAVSGWIDLFEARKGAFLQRGISYIQMVIPEKISTLSDFLPGSTGGSTPFLAGIESEISKREILKQSYVSALSILLQGDRPLAWRALDSHLSPFGARALFNALALSMGHNCLSEVLPSRGFIETGDLALRFFGTPLYETVQYFDEQDVVKSRKKTFEHMALPKHIGRKIEWENPEAPIGKSVIAFGNSFMDGGGRQPSLSYWLSVNCSEYKFNFNPNVDWAYIDRVKPDCVICQTAERFLETVPAT